MINYYVFKCSSCGRWDTTYTKKSTLNVNSKCKRCGNTRKWFLDRRKAPGSQVAFYGPFEHPFEAKAVIQEKLEYEATNGHELFVAELCEFEEVTIID